MTKDVLNTYYQETNELLLCLEDSLLDMEDSPNKKTAIDKAFRSIHTIKGTSGSFGFEKIEQFAHSVEHLLDCVRHNEIQPNEQVVALLLSSKDHLEKLVNNLASGNSSDSNLDTKSNILVNEIQKIVSTAPEYNVDQAPEETLPEPTRSTILTSKTTGSPNWHISIRFAKNVLKRGMDPQSILLYLSKLGSIERVVTLWNDLPSLQALDPESCYLQLELELKSTAQRSEIETAFQFIKDDCLVCLIPPDSDLSLYASLLEALPENRSEMLNVLVECAAISSDQIALIDSLTATDINSIRLGGSEDEAEEIMVESGDEPNSNFSISDFESNNRDDSENLDNLINLVGELVISGATTRLLAQQAGNENLLESISRMGRLIEEIRDGVLDRRMTKIGELFSNFNRILKKFNDDSSRCAELKFSGAETELDKSIIEKLSEPLTRMVNSTLERIETKETRVLAGKGPTGALTINAYHDSGNIVIELSDDGLEFPLERLERFGQENGLFSSDQQLSHSELVRIIIDNTISVGVFDELFTNHLLTLQQVKKSIESLRGTMVIDISEDLTSEITIRLPLTLAIIDGFLVGVGDSSYVVPLDMVLECVELEHTDLHIDKSQSYINLRGEVLPFIRLKEIFRESNKNNTRENVVVVEFGNMRAGLVVDELKGEVQTVIKPLGRILQNIKGISGATILGSGNVAVILDVPNLIQRAIFSLKETENKDILH